jgi:hypothetical protein
MMSFLCSILAATWVACPAVVLLAVLLIEGIPTTGDDVNVSGVK